MNASPNKPSSPCTKVCVIEEASGLCIGCGRSRDEIASWGALPEGRRRAIIAGLPARLRAVRLPSAEASAG
ncbi:DUF1289 domain-containing protein [uncultured Methylobacterium sp.]|uniref:DUF1289 domain-containing protein n=1 Tax=uncultured Methylobacterium sp. TaxID=157278 RepID=UPI0035CBA731